MGSVGRTIATDANAGYWNPALLPCVHDISLTGMTTTLLGVTKYNQFALSMPLNETDVIAGTYIGFNVDQMELHGIKTDSTPTPEGYFSTQKNALMVSYGHKMSPSINIGFTGKYGSRRVYNSQDSVIAVDAGTYANFGDLQVGGTLRNLVAIKLGEQTDDNYELDFDCGTSLKMKDLLISFDIARFLRKDTSYFLGVEYSALSIKDNFDLKLRGGINSNEVSLGLGILTAPIYFDYAFLIRPLSQEHLFSMGISLENSSIKNNAYESEKWTQKVFDAIDKNDFSVAQQYIKLNLDQDPNNQKMQILDQQIGLILEILANRLIKDSNGQRLLYESIHRCINGDYDLSVDIAEYLTRRNHSIQVFNYKQLLENATGLVSRYKGVDLVQFNMELSKKERLVNHIESSIKCLSTVVFFEPNNIEALKQLGDNYVLLNDKKMAIEVYERAHLFQPDNKEISESLSQLTKKTT